MDAFLASVITSFLGGAMAFGSALYVFKSQKKSQAALILFNEFYGHEMHIIRRDVCNFVESVLKESTDGRISWSSLLIIASEYDRNNEDKINYTDIERKIIFLIQFFERCVLLYERDLIDRTEIWNMMGRQFKWWNCNIINFIDDDGQDEGSFQIATRLVDIVRSNTPSNTFVIVNGVSRPYHR